MSTTKYSKKSKTAPNTFIQKKMKNSVKQSAGNKQKSMEDSQGVSDFSGSGVNAPGKVDRKKRDTNMNQKNF